MKFRGGFTSGFLGEDNKNLVGVDLRNVRDNAKKVYLNEYGDSSLITEYKNLLNGYQRDQKKLKHKLGRDILVSGINYQWDRDSYIPDTEAGRKLSCVDGLRDSMEGLNQFSRAARLDVLPKSAGCVRKEGTDAGEIRFKNDDIGNGNRVLISIPKDSAYNERSEIKYKGDTVKVGAGSEAKKLRKFLKQHPEKVNSMSRETLEFILGKNNPNINKIMSNAKSEKTDNNKNFLYKAYNGDNTVMNSIEQGNQAMAKIKANIEKSAAEAQTKLDFMYAGNLLKEHFRK